MICYIFTNKLYEKALLKNFEDIIKKISNLLISDFMSF